MRTHTTTTTTTIEIRGPFGGPLTIIVFETPFLGKLKKFGDLWQNLVKFVVKMSNFY